jgi:hypothetical protein
MLEDALNLADALELAFLEYEPLNPRKFPEISLAGVVNPLHELHPSIGVINALVDLCRQGAFWIEKV